VVRAAWPLTAPLGNGRLWSTARGGQQRAVSAATYALPREWNQRFGLRRYGFHGLSHAYAARRAADLVGRPLDELRIVTCHLGAGASLAAIAGGRSVDTTMGFTPLAGLVMATRTGSVDPGLLLWLQHHAGVGLEELADVLEHRSGLAGLAGGSGDMREVQRAAAVGDRDAALALAVYLHRLRREIAAMTAALGGWTCWCSPAESGSTARRSGRPPAAGLDYLGVRLDGQVNRDADTDADISAIDAGVRTVVVSAREDVEIARHTRQVLAGERRSAGTRPEPLPGRPKDSALPRVERAG
jgi:acetate kinase